MYAKKFHIGTGDVDPFYDLSLAGLFRFMQDIATEHAEKIGVGKSNTMDKGMYWVITRYSVSIKRMPRYLDDIVVKTYPGRNMKFIFPRLFQIETVDGEVLIRASSTWMVLNKSDHKINMDPFHGFLLPSEHDDLEEGNPAKVIVNDVSHIIDRLVQYSDTDLNGHLNNTKYVDYVIDLHSHDFYSKKFIKHFTINYEREVKQGEIVSMFRSENNGVDIVNGRVGNNSCFSAEIVYGDK